MALNQGSYCSARCLDVLRGHDSNPSLRIYPPADSRDLRKLIAATVGLGAENVFLGKGSGPLLKVAVPVVIEQQIRKSPWRMIKHLLFKNAYPLCTPRLTYGKFALAVLKHGVEVR